jgi:hypothetical protein
VRTQDIVVNYELQTKINGTWTQIFSGQDISYQFLPDMASGPNFEFRVTAIYDFNGDVSITSSISNTTRARTGT